MLITCSSLKSQINCILPSDTFHSYNMAPLLSQNCNNTNTNTNTDYINKYKKFESYIPDDNTPIKHIKICINIFTGPGTVQNNATTIAAINQMVEWTNGFYTNIVPPSYAIPGVIPLTDTKIRFDLDNRIYFYDGTTLYNNTSISTLQNYVASVDPTRLDNLNIYCTAGSSSPYAIAPFPIFILGSYYGNAGSLYGDQGVFMHIDGTSGFVYANSQTLAHELRHCLDLFHTYNPSCCHETCNETDPEYLGDVFGANPPAYCWEYGGWGCTITPGQNLCTNNGMGGNNLLNYFFSPSQIGKMHRALSIKTTRRYVKDDAYNVVPMIITNDETWNFDIRLYSNLIVNPGVTLTLTCNIQMPRQGKVIVEPGGKLIVDGGTLTSGCSGDLWQGIEVQGNTYLPQTPTNQGYVELKNAARIEYANTAIYTAKLNANGSDDPSGYGGIVKVDNATFYNNYSSIWIKNYYNPFGAPQTNQSTISNSTFEVDKPYYDMVETPPGFINLALVENVKIQNNVLKNTCATAPFGNRNYGIYSTDASYNLGENNQFVGLKYGILSMNTIPSFTPTIDHCTFTNCYRGIYLSGVTNPTVTFNTMSVPSDNNNCYGLYLDNCPTFNVQENTFAGIGSTNGDFGIIINNCGETSKKIYNNVFTNINIGTQAQNQNKNLTGSTGLQIKCNDYTNTLYDITVMKDATVTIGGIARYQGVNGTQPWNPAGNLFSHNTMDYTNSVRSNITYVHHTSPRCIPTIDGNITLSSGNFSWINKPTCCPSEFTEGSSDLAGLKSSISSFQNLINTTNVQLQTLVDGGNTTLLEMQVDNSLPPQALQLRNDLISKSPYLSDSVMVSAIENEDGLPPSMLTQVLVANPSGVKSPDVLDKLDSRENPLPEYMIQQILAGQNRIAEKEKLESKVCSYTLQRDMAWDKIGRIFKNDTIHPWANDSLMALYGSDPRLAAKYELVFAKMGKNQSNEAMQLLNSLPQNFVMEESQNEEYNDYVVLAGIYADLHQNNKTWQGMNNAQKEALQVLAGKQKNRADMYAINILRTTGVYSYSEPILHAGSGGGKMLFGIGKNNNSQPINTDVQLKVYPNPAKDYFIIDYLLLEGNASAIISFTDITGKLVKSIDIHDMQNQIVVETKDMQPGIYYINLTRNNSISKTVKIAVFKQ